MNRLCCMERAIVKAYQRKYKTKSKVNETVKQTKQINIPVASDLEGDDVVYILTEDEYNSLSSEDDTVISELQSSLDSQKQIVNRLNKELEEYKEREKVATDILSLNNKLITDNKELNIELRENDKLINELKLVNQLLLNRGLISRMLNKKVNLNSNTDNVIETRKE